MLSIFFPPGRLDPVLDGGVGDEDAVLAPQVPTGVAVGQAIFRDKTDGTLLDTASVQAGGPSQVRDITGEAATAAEAAMAGESDHQVNRAVSPSITEVMEGAGGHGIAACAVTTARAGSRRPVATAPLNAGFGQIFDTRDALGGIRDIFPWTSHRLPS
ncbi:MAG: hypothetical protein JOZ17_12330 [Acetobacteraceae bacterium]|nr:hypothetical protein [Acetobacteraceae bacterium]